MARQQRTYAPADRPAVQVLVEGQWCPGDLRMWTQHDDGTWHADVQWKHPGETSHYISGFPADRVRPDQTDYARGRAQHSPK